MRVARSPISSAGRQAKPWPCLAAILFGCWPALAAPAEQPLTLEQAERLALADEPGAQALLAQARAHDELATAADALPDPQIHFGAANLPLEAGGFRTEGMSQAQVGVRQALPPASSRAAAARQESALAATHRAQADARRRSVVLSVRQAWLDAYLAAGDARLVLQSQTLVADLVTVTRSLYTVGGKNQQDLLRAELELSQLRSRLVATEQRGAEASERLRRWIGAAAQRPVAELPAWPEPPNAEEARSALAEHPLLAAAAAKVRSVEAGVAMAESHFRPMWTLDAAYGYRDGALPNGAPRSDFVSVTAMLSAPVFARSSQVPRLRAAQARHRAALAALDDERRRLAAELAREQRRFEDLGRQLALYRSAVLAQAEANAEATLAAYRSETADFADVMRSYLDDLEVRLAHLRLRVDRRRSQAQLAYLTGAAL